MDKSFCFFFQKEALSFFVMPKACYSHDKRNKKRLSI